LGKVIGRFSTYENLFKYSLESRKDSFSELNGLFKVQESKYKQFKDRYRIASTLTLTDLEGTQIRVVFNNMISNYIVDIRKSGKNMCEEVRLFFKGDDLCIEHFAYPNLRKRQDIAKIKMTLEDEAESFPAIFDFLGNVPYQKDIGLKCKSSKFEAYNNYVNLQSVDYDDIASEIAENDSALFDFIDEIRNRLTFLANGITPVSFYDRTARLCFYKETDKFKLDFSGAKDAKIALEHNLILRRMARHEQERK
ncbi:MAG TPA: hypothetical protein DCY94_04180, partial [Firmicutes bacterium]|nr:hypothetical protein [Bacillota bacterium]